LISKIEKAKDYGACLLLAYDIVPFLLLLICSYNRFSSAHQNIVLFCSLKYVDSALCEKLLERQIADDVIGRLFIIKNCNIGGFWAVSVPIRFPLGFLGNWWRGVDSIIGAHEKTLKIGSGKNF